MKWPINSCCRYQVELSALAILPKVPEASPFNVREAAAAKHLARCPTCQAQFKQLHELCLELKRCATVPSVAPSASFHQAWRRQLIAERGQHTAFAGAVDRIGWWLFHPYTVRGALAGIWLLAGALYLAQPAAPQVTTTASPATFAEIRATLKSDLQLRSKSISGLSRSAESEVHPSVKNDTSRTDHREIERRTA